MRILILRTSALGDIVHALPVLSALRKHLPSARIGWLVEAPYASILQDHPDLNEVIPVRLRSWRQQPFSRETLSETLRFFRALEQFSADVVLDLMGNHKSGALAALTMADRRLGVARDFRREPSSALWISEPVVPVGQHAIDVGLSVARHLGIPCEPADFGAEKLFPGTPAAAAEVLDSTSGLRVLIHPGAGWDNKRWPPERWGAVARRLEETAEIRSWVAAGAGERHLVETAVEASRGAAEPITAQGLDVLAALSRRASLVMGGDTGPIHLAHALGTPVLSLHGPTDPLRNGPYLHPDHCLSHTLPCSFCHKRLGEIKACLLEITVDQVVERAKWILALSDARRRC